MSVETVPLKIIAHIRTDFSTKFGVPRQSGLIPELKAEIIFVPEYRNADALRGIEGFSHLWLLWQFSGAVRKDWSPTVRPPRLGGNARMGVFATRSPYRPNAIGLSCVRLERVETGTPEGPVLHVAGADLMDRTPIFDIKPYLPYADCVPEAVGGYVDGLAERRLTVACKPELLARLPEEKQAALLEVLARDPRPRYQNDPERVYGFRFAGQEVQFRVAGDALTVLKIEPAADKGITEA